MNRPLRHSRLRYCTILQVSLRISVDLLGNSKCVSKAIYQSANSKNFDFRNLGPSAVSTRACKKKLRTTETQQNKYMNHVR